VCLLFKLLYSIRVRLNSEDKLRWSLSREGLFIVGSYNVLACNDDTHFSWKSIWQAKVHLRAATIFA
jgi:hypothetical protein